MVSEWPQRHQAPCPPRDAQVRAMERRRLYSLVLTAKAFIIKRGRRLRSALFFMVSSNRMTERRFPPPWSIEKIPGGLQAASQSWARQVLWAESP